MCSFIAMSFTGSTSYSVHLMFMVLDELNERFEATVHPDKVTAVLLLGQPIDGAGAQHFQLRTLCVLK